MLILKVVLLYPQIEDHALKGFFVCHIRLFKTLSFAPFVKIF